MFRELRDRMVTATIHKNNICCVFYFLLPEERIQ